MPSFLLVALTLVPAVADAGRLWGELHRIVYAQLRSSAASPTEVARMAWGFSQVQLFVLKKSIAVPLCTTVSCIEVSSVRNRCCDMQHVEGNQKKHAKPTVSIWDINS